MNDTASIPSEELPDEVIQTIVGCARCHGDGHAELRFRKLAHSHPGGDDPVQWTHWAVCPATGEPILWRKTKEIAPS